MSTFRELVYMVNDELKLTSDDSLFTELHIIFLLKKYRASLLYLKYILEKVYKLLDESNELLLCIDLEKVNDGDCSNTYLKSKLKIPDLLLMSSLKITLDDPFAGDIAWVSPRRMIYVGNNKWLKNIIYAARGGDHYLYLRSSNPLAYYLNKVRVTGVFEDPEKAAEFECTATNDEDPCNIMDKEFPIEESLISALLQSVVKELSAVTDNPLDSQNNASDDLSNIQYYVKKNMKTATLKLMEGHNS